jgi:hypothetical protein
MESELLRHLAAEPTRVLTAASCCARGGASRPEATHALSTPRLPAAQEAGAGRGAAPGRQRSGRPLPAVGGVRPERAGGGQGRSSDGHGRRSAFSGLVELASDPRSVHRRRRCLRCGGSGDAAADAPGRERPGPALGLHPRACDPQAKGSRRHATLTTGYGRALRPIGRLEGGQRAAEGRAWGRRSSAGDPGPPGAERAAPGAP